MGAESPKEECGLFGVWAPGEEVARLYAPNRLLIAHSQGHLELWRIPESGESTDPPVRISAPLGRNSADTGIALDPAHKEVIIATAAGNTIMTFSVPEVFDAATSTR